jgi:hypothetical protein
MHASWSFADDAINIRHLQNDLAPVAVRDGKTKGSVSVRAFDTLGMWFDRTCSKVGHGRSMVVQNNSTSIRGSHM